MSKIRVSDLSANTKAELTENQLRHVTGGATSRFNGQLQITDDVTIHGPSTSAADYAVWRENFGQSVNP